MAFYDTKLITFWGKASRDEADAGGLLILLIVRHINSLTSRWHRVIAALSLSWVALNKV